MNTQINNFDILIGPKTNDGYAVRVTNSPAGQNPDPVYQTIPHNNITDLLLYVQNLVADLKDMKELGDNLFRFLFPEPVKEKFDRCQPKGDGELLRIRLHWDSTEAMADLGRLPWEYICDSHGFLAHKRTLSLTRFLHDDAPSTLQSPDTLKILAVSAAPRNLPPIKVDEELQHLQDVIDEVAEHGKIELNTIHNATRIELRQAIVNYRPHILHFAGHGQRQAQTAGLIFCTAEGTADFITAEELRVLLNHGPIRLAILNGCETAAQPKDDSTPDVAVQSVAAQLVGAGLPAVIGMQYALPDSIAPTFMKELYRRILKNEPLDQAMTETRIALYFDHEDKNFWALPALYLRVDDGRLFKPPTSELIDSVSTGLDALGRLIKVPNIRAAVLAFQNEIELLQNKLEIINYFKSLHDDLQELEIVYGQMMNDFERLPADTTSWYMLQLTEETAFRDCTTTILQRTENPPTGIEVEPLFSPLRRSATDIQKGVQGQDFEILSKGLGRLFSRLGRGLTRINMQLVANVQSLPLGQLVIYLEPVYQTAVDQVRSDLEAVSQLAQGIEAIRQLQDELQVQVKCHNSWQNFDDELRRIYTSLHDNLDELEDSWPYVKRMAEDLAVYESANERPWLQAHAGSSVYVEKSIETTMPIQLVVRSFREYRSHATRQFRKVDKELLELCRRLVTISQPLDSLLRAIQ